MIKIGALQSARYRIYPSLDSNPYNYNELNEALHYGVTYFHLGLHTPKSCSRRFTIVVQN